MGGREGEEGGPSKCARSTCKHRHMHQDDYMSMQISIHAYAGQTIRSGGGTGPTRSYRPVHAGMQMVLQAMDNKSIRSERVCAPIHTSMQALCAPYTTAFQC